MSEQNSVPILDIVYYIQAGGVTWDWDPLGDPTKKSKEEEFLHF